MKGEYFVFRSSPRGGVSAVCNELRDEVGIYSKDFEIEFIGGVCMFRDGDLWIAMQAAVITRKP